MTRWLDMPVSVSGVVCVLGIIIVRMACYLGLPLRIRYKKSDE